VHRTPVLLETAAAAALNRLSAEPAVTQLRLAGLDRAEIGQMSVALTGPPVDEQVAAALHARTGGRPLFASELIRLMASEPGSASESAGASNLASAWHIPSGTRGVIEQRLARLPADCRNLLATAAVAGREVDLDVLARV
jgi:predicted ATPase